MPCASMSVGSLWRRAHPHDRDNRCVESSWRMTLSLPTTRLGGGRCAPTLGKHDLLFLCSCHVLMAAARALVSGLCLHNARPLYLGSDHAQFSRVYSGQLSSMSHFAKVTTNRRADMQCYRTELPCNFPAQSLGHDNRYQGLCRTYAACPLRVFLHRWQL